jgi:hypothetical protein
LSDRIISCSLFADHVYHFALNIFYLSRFLAINIEGKIGQLTVRRTSSFINQIRAPGGHIQITNMIDTQQQYIKLNIRGESKADKDE